MNIETPSRLTDSELITQVGQLARGERMSTVALIIHLAEFDGRRLYAAEGFSSTFSYCREVLRLSEDAAFSRIRAARLARKYPVVFDMLLEGTLSPTTTRMLARHVTADNGAALLAAAAGKGKREVETLLTGLFPRADVRSVVRPLRSPKEISFPESSAASRPPEMPKTGTTEVAAPPALSASHESSRVRVGNEGLRPAVVTPPPAPHEVARPVSAARYEIRFTASAETHDRLRRAQDLLGHAIPSGDLAEVFDRALALLVADLEKKRFAATARPQKGMSESSESRHIPAAVRRLVSKRDRERCAFLGSGGRRCDARRFLEFHHLKPFAVGGPSTADNIQLRCRSHNRHEADLFFGPLRRAAEANPPVPERVDVAWTRSPEAQASFTNR